MSKNKFPIYVPSKGRPNSKTINKFYGKDDNLIIVLEPQDYKLYKANYPNAKFEVLPENDKGIVYVRNHILALNKSWYWMLDDDIDNFYIRIGNRMKKVGSSILRRFEKEVTSSKNKSIAQIALEYTQFAWSASNSHVINGYCDVCVAIDASKVIPKGIKYDDSLELKEDRDFTLQIITGGLKTLRTTKIAFSCPKNGANDGGLKDIYETKGFEENKSFKMIEKWGKEICQMNYKNDGRPDVKINWRLFQ